MLCSFGEHYWKTEFYMDCSEAEDGWFELKGMITNGPGWEGDIAQVRLFIHPWCRYYIV